MFLFSLFWGVFIRGLAVFLPLPMGVFVYSSIFFIVCPLTLNGVTCLVPWRAVLTC